MAITNLTQSPNWLDLPNPLLHSILDLVSSSIPDLLAFSAVCSQWRSLYKSTTLPLPPLLLHLNPNHSNSDDDESSFFPFTQPFPQSPPSLHPTSFLSKTSAQSLLTKCVGHSYGHLIFASPRNGDALVADVFASKEFRPPKLPSCCSSANISFGFLTAPRSSPSCVLLLVTWNSVSGSDILSWQLGADGDGSGWSVLDLSPSHFIYSALVFSTGKVFCLLRDYSLLVFEPVVLPITSWKVVEVRFSNAPEGFVYPRRLVECNGELFLVLFVHSQVFDSLIKSRVYRLDFKDYVWVEVESIGDWCLFKDGVGRGFLAFPSPSRWGGRSNCIYVSDFQKGSFNVIPLHSTHFDSSHLNPRGEGFPPVWVHPSL